MCSSDPKEQNLRFLREELTITKDENSQVWKARSATAKLNKNLKKKIATLELELSERDAKIEEMEEEGEDLRRENKALLSDDDDYLEEDMDMEREEEDDDDDFINDDDSKEVFSEEDPEEPSFDEDVDIMD